jgi:hypothetical protein
MKSIKISLSLFTVLFLVGISARAGLNNDTLNKKKTINSTGGLSSDEADSKADDSVAYALLNTDNSFSKKTLNRKALFNFLHSSTYKTTSRNKKLANKLSYRLAKIFAGMKAYPLAMQYYSNTMTETDEIAEMDSLSDNEDASPVPGNFLEVNGQSVDFRPSNNDSEPVNNADITGSFNDGKNAVAYAMIIQVKQPVPGKRKAFTHLNNVGHMFITLIKYNADSTAVSRSFGFYPDKENLFSATPLVPVSPSVFKDDELHDWDEFIGKFISAKRFEKVIRLVRHFENRTYHLSNNNCTDFGLYAADVAGITINGTHGKWPLGHGNNPANAGQSILEGKFVNADTGNGEGLFVCANVK